MKSHPVHPPVRFMPHGCKISDMSAKRQRLRATQMKCLTGGRSRKSIVNGKNPMPPRPCIEAIWPIANVSECPDITLLQWQIFEVQLSERPNKTRHFVGYSVGSCKGQVSSAIQKFDPKTLRGVTESGRVYQLQGSPGWDADADYIWGRWKLMWGITSEVDVTRSIESSRENEA